MTEITSTRSNFPDLAEAWRQRSLAFTLARRNLKLRYVQTLLGSVWAFIQPILLTGMLTLVFGMLLAVPSDGIPYVLFAFAGTALWTTANRTLNETSTSLAGSGGIILKVYFPRILVPVSAAITAVADAAPVYALLLVATVAMGYFPGWPVLAAPAFLLLAALLAFALGLAVTAVDAVFRDVRLLIPAGMQFLFYLTPIMYSESVVPERWMALYRLNPFLGLIKGFRWSMIAQSPPPELLDVLWTCTFTGVVLFFGLLMFSRLENYAVDRI